MTIGYIGRSYDLKPRDIDRRTGFPAPRRHHPCTLSEIAEQRGVPVADVVADVEEVIAAMRAERQ